MADALRQVIGERGLQRKYVYVHEAVSDSGPFQLYLPFVEPASYYCVECGSLGWSMPGALGIELAAHGPNGLEAQLVVNAVGNGPALFYLQVRWTGAHQNLPVVYIIMNNLEYRRLIQGRLATVVAAYRSAAGYRWEPAINEPGYLKIQGPDFDFLQIAKSIGVDHGERVTNPANVKAAVEAGIDHALKRKTAYVIEIFSDPAVTPDGPKPAATTRKRFVAARDIGEPRRPATSRRWLCITTRREISRDGKQRRCGMAKKSESIHDVVIVGGGVSGLYTAWRILTGQPKNGRSQPAKSVKVLELSKRTGGRLLTWRPFPDDTGLHGELGGMRFFKQQQLVWSLIQYFVAGQQLQPPSKFFVADPNGNNLTYLRQRILKNADLSDPDKVPYILDAACRYASPGAIAAGVIQTILLANRETIAKLLAGKTQPTSWEEWDKVKPSLAYGGKRLWDVGFWNVLLELLSPEGYNFVTDGFGYYTLTNNWNAAEAMQSVYLDFTQNPDYQTLVEGYDYLPGLLKFEVEKAGGEVLLEHAVTKIDRENGGSYALHLGERDPIRAKKVVLAMPRRSLELLDETEFWNWQRVVLKTPNRSLRLVDYIQSVIPYPAFKMFMAYETPWWRQPPVSIAAGRSVSDLPIRQTYYFPPVPDAFRSPLPTLMEGPALLMASYDDLGAVSFWRSLEDPRDLQPQIHTRMMAAASKAFPSARSYETQFQQHVAEMSRAMAEEPGFFAAPPEMIRHAQAQLRYLHFNQPLPDPMPNPQGEPGELLAVYKDWGHDPYGGGWNFWAPGVDVQSIMRGIRRPFPQDDLFIIGEAYSGNQGWVEGALTTAEHVLRDHFQLKPAPWQPSSVYLGY